MMCEGARISSFMPHTIRAIAAFIALVAVQGAQHPKFVWTYRGKILGSMQAPPGYSSETDNYVEGIVTTLHYRDGSYIIMQAGLMYRVPLFQNPENKLVASVDSAAKMIRVGEYTTSKRFWREDNYKPRKAVGTAVHFFSIIAPNVGYANVPLEKRNEFDKALDSFVREIERNRKH